MRFTDRSSQTNRPSIELSPLKVRRLSISARCRFPKYSPADAAKTQMCAAAVAVFPPHRQQWIAAPSSFSRSLLAAQFASREASEAPAVVVFDVGQQLEAAR